MDVPVNMDQFLTTQPEICYNQMVAILNLTDDPEAAIPMVFSKMDRFIKYIITPIIASIGIAGNGAFLYACIRVKSLRGSSITAYLANLAVCDVLFLLSLVIWNVDKNQISSSLPVYSIFGCAIWVISTRWWYFASIAIVTMVSVERYFAICHPIKHRVIERFRTIKLLIAMWMITLLITLTIIPRFGRLVTVCIIWPNDDETFAEFLNVFTFCKPLNTFADVYGSLISITTLILAMVLNSCLYVNIVMALRNRPNLSTENAQRNRDRNQVTRTLVATGIIFFVCQVPFRVLSIDDLLDQNGSAGFLDSEREEVLALSIGRTFILLNSVINPYVYVLSCKRYRKALSEAFCVKRVFSPSSRTNEDGNDVSHENYTENKNTGV